MNTEGEFEDFCLICRCVHHTMETHTDTDLGSTWQEFLPGCQILSANNLPWEGGIAEEAVVRHFKFNKKQNQSLCDATHPGQYL